MINILRNLKNTFFKWMHLFKVKTKAWRYEFTHKKDGFNEDRYQKEFYFNKPKDPNSVKITNAFMDYFEFDSVLDLGCYIGHFIKHFKDNGKTICGVDGDWIDREVLLPSVSDDIILHNLEKPLGLNRKFDLVMSLETAENIYPGTEVQFLENMVNHSNRHIVFSACRIGQGSAGWHQHKCFHTPSWWASQMEKLGPKYLLHETAELSGILHEKGVPEWYVNNLSVFRVN